MKHSLIFTHGFAASRLQWKYQLEAFEQAGYPTFAVDLLGHGEGVKPRRLREYTIERMYRDYTRCYQRFGIRRPVLVGHSLGSYISLRYAVQHPSKVERLILISPLFSPVQLAAAPSLFLKIPKVSEVLLRAAPAWTIQWIIHRNRIDSHGLARPVVRQVAMDYKRADSRIVYFGQTLRDISAGLNALCIPTLVIWGDNDRTLAPRYIMDLLDRCPDVRQLRIPGGGHALPLTHPGPVNRAILDFLA